MSTLQQSLHHRRVEQSDIACVSATAPGPALVVCTWQGDSWVLPWSHFVSARFADGGDRLEILFAAYLVTVTGQNLAGLLDDVAAFRLRCVRDLPADYRRKVGEDQPFISQLEVRAFSPESRDSPV